MKRFEKSELLTGDITSAILKMAFPLMGIGFIQMAYTLTDIIWLGRLSTGSVSAVGTVGFFVWITESIILIGKTGVVVGLSQAHGRGDDEEAEEVMRSGAQIHYLIGALLIAFYLIFAKKIIGIYDLSERVFNETLKYFYIVTVGYVFSFSNSIMVTNFSARGDSVIPFKVSIAALILNIVLDPLLIFGVGFFPRLEVAGAALATVLAQALATVLYLYFSKMYKTEFVTTNYFKLAPKKYYGRIFAIGGPAASQSLIHAGVGTVLNKYISSYGEIYIAVYSIGAQIESITWLSSEGIATAFSAFMGQNLGAKNYDRLEDGRKVGLRIMIIIGTIGSVLLFAFSNRFFQFFVPEDLLTQVEGAKYLRIISPSEFFMCIQIGTAGMLNGLGLSRYPAYASAVSNISRIFISLLLMPYIGVLGIWAAMSITTVLNGIAETVLYVMIRNKTNGFRTI